MTTAPSVRTMATPSLGVDEATFRRSGTTHAQLSQGESPWSSRDLNRRQAVGPRPSGTEPGPADARRPDLFALRDRRLVDAVSARLAIPHARRLRSRCAKRTRGAPS